MKKILIANWKMNLDKKETFSFIKKIQDYNSKKIELVLAPSTPFVLEAGELLKKKKVSVAAQNVSAWSRGAYTGETSAKMLKQCGCRYVIVGHSERRVKLGETDDMINQKISNVLENKMIPIVCFGETDPQKKQGLRETVIIRQLRDALKKIKNLSKSKIILAYEPVWAIGSGKAVTVEDLQEVQKIVKRTVGMICSIKFYEENAQFVYGGSVDEKNIEKFLQIENVDGFLVGGASLKAKSLKNLAQKIELA